jgi:hypothetical protein
VAQQSLHGGFADAVERPLEYHAPAPSPPDNDKEIPPLPRSKSTARAEARRRHRAAQSIEPNVLTGDVLAPGESGVAATSEAAPARRSLFGFRAPNVRADLKLLPDELRTNRWVWVAFALMVTAPLAYVISTYLSADGAGPLRFYYGLMVTPPAIPVLVGGFTARHAQYLVGFLLGILNAAVVVVIGTASLQSGAVATGDLLTVSASYFVYASLMGAVFGGLAGWYRRFLGDNSRRQQAARQARAQDQRRKAKQETRPGRTGR